MTVSRWLSATKGSVLSKVVRVALLGCGVVGTEVARILLEQSADLGKRIGGELKLVGIAVRDVKTPRDAAIPTELLTEDANSLVANSDLVIEVMGGIEPAKSLLLAAIAGGASVVTANKALLAQHGPVLYQAADEAGVDIYYEAAVAGAIPIVRSIRESLTGDSVQRILGIVNGTTNYILDQMTSEGLGFEQALTQAQQLGYAEADPTADVEGHDAAAKAAILASLAFHTRVNLDDVDCEGISAISAEDVKWAKLTNHVIKLLAICERTEDGVGVRVHPALVSNSHPLSTVRGAFNAVFVEAAAAGELMFYGRGAGGSATASAVLGDVVSIARHIVQGGKGPVESKYAMLPISDKNSANTRYQIRLAIADRSGVLAKVSQVFADNGVSIQTVQQVSHEEAGQESSLLLLTTHKASEGALAKTVAEVESLSIVHSVESVLRVI